MTQILVLDGPASTSQEFQPMKVFLKSPPEFISPLAPTAPSDCCLPIATALNCHLLNAAILPWTRSLHSQKNGPKITVNPLLLLETFLLVAPEVFTAWSFA